MCFLCSVCSLITQCGPCASNYSRSYYLKTSPENLQKYCGFRGYICYSLGISLTIPIMLEQPKTPVFSTMLNDMNHKTHSHATGGNTFISNKTSLHSFKYLFQKKKNISISRLASAFIIKRLTLVLLDLSSTAFPHIAIRWVIMFTFFWISTCNSHPD